MDDEVDLLGSDVDFPSQDDIDRRDHFAFIVHFSGKLPNNFTPEQAHQVVEVFWPARDDFPFELARAVTDAVDESAGLALFPKPTAVHYQIGPMAGGLGNTADFILTLAESVDDIPAAFDLLANSYTVDYCRCFQSLID